MESVKNKLISAIEKISKDYQFHGFWKFVDSAHYYVDKISWENNPYLYFPSEKYTHKALMEEFDKLTEEDFKPIEGVNGFLYFKDGDKLDIPFEVFKQKPQIHINVPYDSDEPCEVSLSFKRPENETEIYERLLAKIVKNAQQKYIKSLDC